jgi:hypothetical protein
MDSKSAGEDIQLSVLSRENETGERESRRINVTLTDQLDYYLRQFFPSHIQENCLEEEECVEKYTMFLRASSTAGWFWPS